MNKQCSVVDLVFIFYVNSNNDSLSLVHSLMAMLWFNLKHAINTCGLLNLQNTKKKANLPLPFDV